MQLQKRCVVIFERGFRQDEHLNSLVRDVSSLSMCHNIMQYSYPELFVPEFTLPISTSSFLALREAYTIFDHFFKKFFFYFILHLEACSRCIPSFSAFQGSTTKLCAIWSMLLYSIISRVRRNLREAGVRRNLREAGNRSGHLCVKYGITSYTSVTVATTQPRKEVMSPVPVYPRVRERDASKFW